MTTADSLPRKGRCGRSTICLHPCRPGVLASRGCQAVETTRSASVSCDALKFAACMNRAPVGAVCSPFCWLAVPICLLALPEEKLPRRRTQHAAFHSCSPGLPDGKQRAALAVIDTGARGTNQVTRHCHSSDSTVVCTLLAIERSRRIMQPMHSSPCMVLPICLAACVLQFACQYGQTPAPSHRTWKREK